MWYYNALCHHSGRKERDCTNFDETWSRCKYYASRWPISSLGLLSGFESKYFCVHLIFFDPKDDKYEMAELLLQNNANPNAARFDGSTPLIVAAFFGQIRLVKLLLKYKANIFHLFSGWTAKTLAKHRKHFDVAQLLEEEEKNQTEEQQNESL